MNPFSANYATARQRFQQAASQLGWSVESCPTDGTGPQGESLSIDVASSSPPDARPVLLISSGLHGVEGFLGSAVQLALLEQLRQRSNQSCPVRYLLLHSLNPYGFAWLRRCDADNIDPNRNFLLDAAEYRGSSPEYARLDPFLNPRRAPARYDLFLVRALWEVVKHGRPALRRAIAAGQYDFPQGLFFGGHRASQTKTILQQRLPAWLGTPNVVVHLDFHTGLGGWGKPQLLIDYPLHEQDRHWMLRTWGGYLFDATETREVAYRAQGSLGQWCVAQNWSASYRFAFVEFGTYGNLRVLAGLRAENQAHHRGRAEDAGTQAAKQELRDLFCPGSPAWRTRVVASSLEILNRASHGLTAQP